MNASLLTTLIPSIDSCHHSCWLSFFVHFQKLHERHGSREDGGPQRQTHCTFIRPWILCYTPECQFLLSHTLLPAIHPSLWAGSFVMGKTYIFNALSLAACAKWDCLRLKLWTQFLPENLKGRWQKIGMAEERYNFVWLFVPVSHQGWFQSAHSKHSKMASDISQTKFWCKTPEQAGFRTLQIRPAPLLQTHFAGLTCRQFLARDNKVCNYLRCLHEEILWLQWWMWVK